MKVGDYVRTKKGILKIRDDRPFKDDKNKLNYLTYGNYTCVLKEDIIKSSPNIIDLIGVGDYVNGECVYSRCETKLWLDGDTGEILIIDGEPDEPIKSIVTKEQFESMSYRVGG